jgi:hypothetical protein
MEPSLREKATSWLLLVVRREAKPRMIGLAIVLTGWTRDGGERISAE